MGIKEGNVNGRSISDPMNVKVRSHLGEASEDLTGYVKPIARKKQKLWLYAIINNYVSKKVSLYSNLCNAGISITQKPLEFL